MSLSAQVAVPGAESDLASSRDYTRRVKNPPAKQAIQVRSLSQKIPRRGKWQSLHYSCLGNPMDGGVLGVAKESDMIQQLSKNRTRAHSRVQRYSNTICGVKFNHISLYVYLLFY